MAGRRTNIALLILLAAALGTGGLGYAMGSPWNRWASVSHAVGAFALVGLAPWKTIIARRGLARDRPGRGASIGLAVLVGLSILFGILHSTGLAVSLGGVTAMQIHVAAGILAGPLVVWHVARRPQRPRRTDLSRRTFLRAGALVAGAGAGSVALEGIVRAASLPGADRRFTGSYERGSHDPDRMPVTQWFDDAVPRIDGSAWRLVVAAAGHERSWTYDQVSAFDDRLRETIDCTGGWFAEQDWAGAWLARLLPQGAEGRSLHVVSATGYPRRFPLADAGRLLLATRAGGRALSAGHGFPARIVAPGRRGFWWVKWVTRIEVEDTPWWLQWPYPAA